MRRFITLIIVLVFCFSITNVTAQAYEKVTFTNQIPNGWVKYSVSQAASFAVPASLELRDDASAYAQAIKLIKNSDFYKLACDECNVYSVNFKMVFQPKGINSGTIGSSDAYARVLVNFQELSEENLVEDDFRYASKSDIQVYSDYQKELFTEQIRCIDKKFQNLSTDELNWKDIERKEINGVICLILDFERPGIGGKTKVRIYQFYSGNHFMEFILSYNKTNGQAYSSIIDKFIHTLTFDPKYVQNAIGKDKVSSSSSAKVFTSSLHKLKYTYNTSKFVPAKINNASHMLLKLESTEDDLNYVSVNAFTELDLTGYALNDPDLMAYFRATDSEMTKNKQMGITISMVSSCVPKSFNGVSALRSEFTAMLMGQKQHQIYYRFLNNGELQTICFFFMDGFLRSHSGIENELLNNLYIIK